MLPNVSSLLVSPTLNIFIIYLSCVQFLYHPAARFHTLIGSIISQKSVSEKHHDDNMKAAKRNQQLLEENLLVISFILAT